MEFSCESIGMDQSELQDRVVQGLVERILGEDHDDPESHIHRRAYKEAMAQVEVAVAEVVHQMAEANVFPLAEKLITEHVFQETNKWGEEKGESRTFIEYLEERANAYFTEQVNAKGKAHRDLDNYGQRDWKTAGSRMAVMIDQCLTSQIKGALDIAVENVNITLAEGLAETARVTLAKVAAATKVKIKTE